MHDGKQIMQIYEKRNYRIKVRKKCTVADSDIMQLKTAKISQYSYTLAPKVYLLIITSDIGGGKCVCPRLSVCLSVC